MFSLTKVLVVPAVEKRWTILVLLLFLCSGLVTLPNIATVRATEDSWTTMEPMPTAETGLGAAVVNGKIYTIGRNVNYEYDPKIDIWIVKKPMLTPRYSFGIAVVQNKIYVIGGINNSTATGINEVYDPETDSWETRTSMPTNRSQLDANVVNGKIYLIGGKTGGQYSTVALNEVYDTETDTWTTKEPIPYPVTRYASAVVDSKIYVVGGQDEFHYPINLNLTQIYDPEVDGWSQGAQLPLEGIWKASAGATTGAMATKRIYVLGGEGGFVEPLDQNYVYDSQSDIWTLGTPMSTPRINQAVAVVNDLIYAIGGTVGWNESTATVEQYTPSGYIPEFPSWIILPLSVIATLAAIICRYRLRRKVKS